VKWNLAASYKISLRLSFLLRRTLYPKKLQDFQHFAEKLYKFAQHFAF